MSEPVNADALRSYVDRVELLHDQRDGVTESIREVYREAKDAGFDTTTLREIVRERRMEPEARHSRYALLASYRDVLGMLADTPLGDAAIARELATQNAFGDDTEPPPFAEPKRRGRPRKQRPIDFLPDIPDTRGSA